MIQFKHILLSNSKSLFGKKSKSVIFLIRLQFLKNMPANVKDLSLITGLFTFKDRNWKVIKILKY
jgi:hypothetical protein